MLEVMFNGNNKMKKQTGIWIDARVWRRYRSLCKREKLRPAKPIEQFLRLIVDGGSALSVLNMLEGMAKERQSSFESYARVLLEWYRNGKMWIYVTDEDEAPVESMLLEALKQVKDHKLRQEIEETLIGKASKKKI
jgi:hypothetical protein